MAIKPLKVTDFSTNLKPIVTSYVSVIVTCLLSCTVSMI